jgi:hypothetical protein
MFTEFVAGEAAYSGLPSNVVFIDVHVIVTTLRAVRFSFLSSESKCPRIMTEFAIFAQRPREVSHLIN